MSKRKLDELYEKVNDKDLEEIYSPGTIDHLHKDKKINPKDRAWFDHLPPGTKEVYLETSKGNVYVRNKDGKFTELSTSFYKLAKRHQLWKVVDELKNAEGRGTGDTKHLRG